MPWSTVNDVNFTSLRVKIATLKGWGPGINISQSTKLGKINFLFSFCIWVSFLKIYGFNNYNKFWVLECEQLTCLCIICPAFVVLEKNILPVGKTSRPTPAFNDIYKNKTHVSFWIRQKVHYFEHVRLSVCLPVDL